MSLDWAALQKRYEEIGQQLSTSSLDQQLRQKLQKEASQLSALLQKHTALQDAQKKIDITKAEMQEVTDSELKVLYQEELAECEQHMHDVQQELDNLLYPPDERDNRSVFLEIRAGAGGQEAALFAGDLMKMYTNYAMSKGWQVSVVDLSETELGGIRDVTL
ncbi:MAG: PCRF domain-containing protein, partial [Candidatus Babeliales bacterium]